MPSDETEQTEFPDMLTGTKKIETYIQKEFGGHICAAYGCSLGGSFVGVLIQRKVIRIDHGIIGSSDLDQAGVLAAKLQAKIVVPIVVKMLHGWKLPGFMEKWMTKRPEEHISVPGTTVHCFYAVKMGEKYQRRYQRHFKEPDIRRHDMQHEELLMRYPEQWTQEVLWNRIKQKITIRKRGRCNFYCTELPDGADLCCFRVCTGNECGKIF